jgi:hypothetical protein
MDEMLTPDYRFDRPIIIVAAPRSGSTLLFETICRAQSLWTIGDESHMVFEHITKLDPQFGICTSNRLVAEDADSSTVERIRHAFFTRLRNSEGDLYSDIQTGSAEKPRFLEKTPKNSLRIPFLDKVFPDALYIYLFRDPRENLSSIIEAWRSSDFVTYSGLADWPGDWSLLLPPHYEQMRGKSLEEIVAFQWQAANQFILNDLGELPKDRWTAVGYAELLADPRTVIERLCQFADIPFDESLQAHCGKALPLSRYTKTAPKTGKWLMNEAMIERVIGSLRPLITSVEAAIAPHSSSAVLTSGPISTQQPKAGDATAEKPQRQLGRNESCYCGSRLRYKHCHGKLQVTHNRTTGTEK